MKNAIEYEVKATKEVVLIARSSDAFQLWQDKKFVELEKHLKALRDAAIKRGEVRA